MRLLRDLKKKKKRKKLWPLKFSFLTGHIEYGLFFVFPESSYHDGTCIQPSARKQKKSFIALIFFNEFLCNLLYGGLSSHSLFILVGNNLVISLSIKREGQLFNFYGSKSYGHYHLDFRYLMRLSRSYCKSFELCFEVCTTPTPPYTCVSLF